MKKDKFIIEDEPIEQCKTTNGSGNISRNNLTKTSKIVKRKNKWCVVNHKTGKTLGCHSTKEEAKKQLSAIFLNSDDNVILKLKKIATDLDNIGLFHIASAITTCIYDVSKQIEKNKIAIKLSKIANILRKKEIHSISEIIIDMIPEVLGMLLENSYRSERPKITAKRAYNIVKVLEKKYNDGLISENSFEFKKKDELKDMLKQGFLFSPSELSKYPKKFNNWWDFFNEKNK